MNAAMAMPFIAASEAGAAAGAAACVTGAAVTAAAGFVTSG